MASDTVYRAHVNPVLALIGLGAVLLFTGAPTMAQGLESHSFIRWTPQSPDDRMFAIALAPDRAATLRDDGADAVNNLLSVDLHFSANTIEQQWLHVQEFLSRPGVEESGNTSIYVKSYSDQLQIDYASVVTRDGRVVEVDPATVQVLLEDDGGVFSDDYRVVVPWPHLEPGARFILGYRLVTDRSRLAAPWSRLVYAQSVHPRERLELSLTWDDDVQPPEVRSDYDGLVCDGDAGSGVHRCAATSIEQVRADYDVNYFDELPHIVITEATTWSEITDLMLGYLHEAWTDDAAIAELTQRLIAGLETDRERLEALSTFVSREIRYVGIGSGTGNLIPHNTGLTLERRFGDCKDKTALFLHMAHHAGLPASAFLVSTQRYRIDRVHAPAISYFNHMIACGGTDEFGYCVDLTDPYTPAALLSPNLSGAISLPLIDGVDAPHPMPEIPYTWMVQVDTDVRLTGRDVIETERRAYGPGFITALRAMLDGMNQRDRNDWLRQNYRDTVGTNVTPEITVTGIDEQQSPLTVATTNTFAGVLRTTGLLRYSHPQPWMADLLYGLSSENRYYDYTVAGVAYREITRFGFEDWMAESTGAQLELVSRFGNLLRTSSIEGDEIVVRTTLEVPSQTIPLADLPAFNRFVTTLLGNSTIQFYVRPSDR
jgi:transglutaminase-like putative cysteine protease